MTADWYVKLDTAATLAALRRAGMYEARWWQGYAGRMVTAATKAGDDAQVAAWQRIADAAAARVAQLTQVVLIEEGV